MAATRAWLITASCDEAEEVRRLETLLDTAGVLPVAHAAALRAAGATPTAGAMVRASKTKAEERPVPCTTTRYKLWMGQHPERSGDNPFPRYRSDLVAGDADGMFAWDISNLFCPPAASRRVSLRGIVRLTGCITSPCGAAGHQLMRAATPHTRPGRALMHPLGPVWSRRAASIKLPQNLSLLARMQRWARLR